MPYNINMEINIIQNKTHDMLPSISSTILHVRCSEYANSESVQSSPIWRYGILKSDVLWFTPSGQYQRFLQIHGMNIIPHISLWAVDKPSLTYVQQYLNTFVIHKIYVIVHRSFTPIKISRFIVYVMRLQGVSIHI